MGRIIASRIYSTGNVCVRPRMRVYADGGNICHVYVLNGFHIESFIFSASQ